MRHDQPNLGKFEGNGSRRLSEALYNMAGWTTTELGDVQDFGWYGLIRRRKHGYIVSEDNFGFFSYEHYPTLQELDKAWTTLETAYTEFCEQTDEAAEKD